MRSAIKEIFTCLLGSMSSFDNGLIFGFSAIALPQMQHQESWFPITEDEASWIASLPALSCAIGSMLISYLMDNVGRKRSMQLQCVPRIIGWLFVAFAPNVYYIYAGRLLSGLGVGMIDSTIQVYISEVTTPSLRNVLGSVPSVTFAIGLLQVYMLGALGLQWNLVATFGALVPLVNLVVLFVLPESPAWLRAKGRTEEMKKALQWFGKSSGGEDPQISTSDSKAETAELSAWQCLLSRTSRRPLLIMLAFFTFQQFCGMNAVTFYTVQMFESSGDGVLSTNQAAIVIGATRLLVVCLSCCLLSRVGRRTVTIISGAGMAVSMTALGIVVLATGTPPLFASLACVATFIAFNTFGFFSIPWVMLGEIIPANCRGLASGLLSSVAYIYIFTVVKIYPFAISLFGEGEVFLVFGCVSATGTLFVYLILPETRGKSLQEIQNLFKR
ncbi:facilitated trehalose transporter Tret1-like [Cloeon dipterum]|uniref:facilitated trehalose transporter Tret1-like n=1 Tax=Cloeon dipterum TaxID=197152 RepID=UPI00321FE0DE